MDSVKLLNRVDTKFTFNSCRLIPLLKDLSQFYNVLDICGLRQCRYKTLYFDTPDLRMFTLHHNGKLNRYKVRLRRYEDSDANYFEIKFKDNKKRTIKKRISRKEFKEEITGKAERFLAETCPFTAEMLKPAVLVYYKRITLVSKSFTERLTIDVNLLFEKDGQQKAFDQLCIVELKQDSSNRSPALDLMRKFHIRDVSMSKYCFGIISLFENAKKNNFKPKLKEINKICYESH